MNSPSTPNVISLPESEGGLSHSESPDGPSTGASGQRVAPANRFRAPVNNSENGMPATSGQNRFASSGSLALGASLANRFREETDKSGQTELGWILKAKVTTSQRLIYQLAHSGRTTKDTAYGGLPTPQASDNRNRGSIGKTPAITRRFNSGKQIGLSMLFDGEICPFCVGAMMGYPLEWPEALAKALGTQSSPKSERRLSAPPKPPECLWEE